MFFDSVPKTHVALVHLLHGTTVCSLANRDLKGGTNSLQMLIKIFKAYHGIMLTLARLECPNITPAGAMSLSEVDLRVMFACL